MAKGSKKGKGLLKDQVANLKAEMTPDQIAQAESMANDDNLFKVAALAFKLHDRPYRKPEGLTKKEQAFYDQMLGISQEAADTWKAKTLAGRPQSKPAADVTAPQSGTVTATASKGGKKTQTA